MNNESEVRGVELEKILTEYAQVNWRDNVSKLQLTESKKFGTMQCDFWRDEKGEILLTREQIGSALEYSNPQKAIDNLHGRNKDRLGKFSVTLDLRGTDGKIYKTTLYTAKGVYEICRFSRQPKANQFTGIVSRTAKFKPNW